MENNEVTLDQNGGLLCSDVLLLRYVIETLPWERIQLHFSRDATRSDAFNETVRRTTKATRRGRNPLSERGRVTAGKQTADESHILVFFFFSTDDEAKPLSTKRAGLRV